MSQVQRAIVPVGPPGGANAEQMFQGGIPVLEAAKRAPWPVWALMIACLVPVPFDFMGLVLTPTRLVLIGFTLPLLFTLASRRLNVCDGLVVVHVAWVALSLGIHHGPEQAVISGGIYGVEFATAYLLARCCIRGLDAVRGTVALLGLFVLATLPLVIIEAMFGVNAFRMLSGQDWWRTDQRYGVFRTAGPFGHAILYGCFCAGIVGLLWFSDVGRTGLRRVALVASVVLASALSMSSGALAVLSVQFHLVMWERVTRNIRGRWVVLSTLALAAYLAIDTLSNRSGMMVMLDRLTLNSHTAYWRTIIFEWGMKSVANHPFVGIGFNDWERPAYMYSGSMDNFWLLGAVRHGIPAFITLAAAVLVVMWRNGLYGGVETRRLCVGFNIAMLGLVVAGCTVHYWSTMLILFGFLLGVGVALHQVARGRHDERTIAFGK